METNSQEYKIKLYNQIEEAYGKVVYTYTTHVIHGAEINDYNNCLKWVQLILSAVSTGGFIGALITNEVLSVWVGGLSSTFLLIITAYFKDLDFSERHKKHLKTSNELWIMREKYLSLLIDFDTYSLEEVVKRRDELMQQTSKIYNSAPITSKRSYEKARRALKENESQFFSREELDKMLPKELRSKI